MTTNLSSKLIHEVNDLNIQGRLNLGPDYQRRMVWKIKDKVYLIDSILQGLPLPKFFVKVNLEESTGKTIYEAVDGKQRLTTILEFIDGKTKDGKIFNLTSKKHPEPETFPSEFEGLTFKTLPSTLQNKFWTYKLSFEELDGTDEEINDMFIRLNASGAKLNAQELRNAAFDGDFKTMVYETCEEFGGYLKKNKILSEDNIRRMIDAEYVSELYISMFNGLQDKKHTINKNYELWSEMDEEEVYMAKHLFNTTTALAEKILGDKFTKTRFKKKNDFYSLFFVLFDLTVNQGRKITPNKYEKIKEALIDLTARVYVKSEDEEMRLYHESCNNAPDTIKSRRFRHNVLMNLIEPFASPAVTVEVTE